MDAISKALKLAQIKAPLFLKQSQHTQAAEFLTVSGKLAYLKPMPAQLVKGQILTSPNLREPRLSGYNVVLQTQQVSRVLAQDCLLHPQSQIVLVVGPPGSGKGSLCQALVDRNAIFLHLSVGDLVRQSLKNPNSSIAQQYAPMVKRGKLIPDAGIEKILLAHLRTLDKQPRIILLDGYPRNLDQWKACQKLFKGRLSVASLELAQETAMDRILNRQQGREDDQQEVAKHRLQVFEQETQPMIAALQADESLHRFVLNAENRPEFTSKEKAIAHQAKQMYEKLSQVSVIEPLLDQAHWHSQMLDFDPGFGTPIFCHPDCVRDWVNGVNFEALRLDTQTPWN